MSAGKGQAVQLASGGPAVSAVSKIERMLRNDFEHVETDAIAGYGMPNGVKRVKLSWPHSEQVQRGSLWITIFLWNFDVRKFPQVSVEDARGSLAHQELAAMASDEGNKPTLGGRWARQLARQGGDPVLLASDA